MGYKKFTKLANWYEAKEDEFPIGKMHAFDMDTAQFATSWDWLMPVVEKIASLKHPVYIYVSHIQKSCIVHEMLNDTALIRNSDTRTSAIEIVYESVVEFIKGYHHS